MIDNETILTFALAACLVAFGFILRGKQQQCSYPWEYILWDKLKEMEKRIMATQEELAAQLTAATEQAAKIGGETRTLLTRIEELLAQIAAGSVVNPELQAAADALKAQLDVVDGLVADEVPPAP